jgi:hypothetical protein
VWVLDERRQRRPADDPCLYWSHFETAGRGLFLWDAFVTEKAKVETRVDDATIAVACFCAALPEPERQTPTPLSDRSCV